jgi:NADH dehydrogenase [ubiquinone] 1 alpha subcomplex assembly factor 5
MSDVVTVFDRHQVRLHRDRAAATLAPVSGVLRDVAERLLDRLDDTTHRFTHALDVGGRGVVAPLLRARGLDVVSCDLSPAMAAISGRCVAADEEFLPFARGSFDLIVASLSLHWVNDLPGALLQLRHALTPDGLFLASLPALGSLAELRQALAESESALAGGISPRVSPFPDLRVLYRDPFAALHDLRAAGEANAVATRDKRIPNRLLFPIALSRLPLRESRACFTLRLAVMTGWAG